MISEGKKSWVAPTLQELAVNQTLGGVFVDLSENFLATLPNGDLAPVGQMS